MPVAPEHAAGGPVYFAWVNANETTFLPEHIRYDEYILKLNIHEQEGDLPSARVTMKNPGALLATGRKRHCWIAFLVDGDVEPAFFGSINAIPNAINQRIIDVLFVAKPADYLARKQAAADALRDLPIYDRIFVDEKFADDPKSVLSGLAADFHHSPTTHAVTISDKLVGEDGVKDFPASKVIFGSLSWSFGDPPKRAVRVEATVTWTQTATGVIDLPRVTVQGPIAGGIMNDWPEVGAQFSGGWSVESASVVDLNGVDKVQTKTYNYSWQNQSEEHSNGDTMSVTESLTTIAGPRGPQPPGRSTPLVDFTYTLQTVVGDPQTGKGASLSFSWGGTHVLTYSVVGDLSLRYNASRGRTEKLTFTMTAGLQPVLNDDGSTDDIETLTLSGGDVGRLVDDGTTVGPSMPIGDLSRRDYFSTERGLQSVEYALNVGRAYLISNSRSVAISFQTPFAEAIGTTCRMNGLVHDPSLPNGQALGKVTSVDLDADGSQGLFIGTIGLACAVGTGASVVEVEGTPVYAEPDVLGPDCQVFEGRYVALGSDDVVYAPPINDVNDDGLVFPLTREQAVVRYETMVIGDQAATLASLMSRIRLPGNIDSIPSQRADADHESANRVQDAFDSQCALWQELEIKPLDKPFEHEHAIAVGPLSIPQQVSLS
jgi:hypothetical protein